MNLADAEFLGVALATLRIWAILRAQVLWQTVVGPLWWVVAVPLAVLVAVVAQPTVEVVDTSLLALLLAELLLGTVLGLVAALPGYAILGGLEASTVTLSLPIVRSRLVFTTGVFVVAAFALSIGVHHSMLTAMVDALHSFAVGRPEAWLSEDMDVVARIALSMHAASALGLALATPVLLTTAVVELASRLIGAGSAPAAAVSDAIRPWLRAAAGLIALGASWAAYPEAWARGLLGELG